MTVDLDLLADFVDGLLEPDEQARVESLVQHDRDWASAHDALLTALPSVAAQLASLPSEPMPEPVLAAVLRSFAAERAADAADEGAAAGQTGGTVKRDVTRPAAGRPPTTGAKRPRRRELRTAALSAFALVLMVAIGLGYVIHNNAQSTYSGSATSGKAAAPEFAGGAPAAGVPPVIVSSGMDYTQLTLSTGFSGLDTNSPSPTSTARTHNSAVPGPTYAGDLDRLKSPAALNACLSEVTRVVGGAPALVDYARFEGRPALIIKIAAPSVVIAVGPDCGLPGRGIDELARS